jgi:hypothetical protein
MKNQISSLVRQAYDLHMHIGPEIIPRKYTVASLIQQETGKIAGIALKNHFYATTPLIAVCKQSSLQLFGSIVLNNFVGGLNADAIYAMSLLAKTRCIVWFPTTSAKQFLQNSMWEVAPEWIRSTKIKSRKAASVPWISVLDKKGAITDNCTQVLKAIKKSDAVLATGHISWQESEKLVLAAKKLRIQQIIITHPIYQRINMPIRIQQKLVTLGAFIEQSYSMYSIDGIPIAAIAAQIKEVGAANSILTSDVGQTFSLSPSEALIDFAILLNNEGITYQELKIMLVTNPKKIMERR